MGIKIEIDEIKEMIHEKYCPGCADRDCDNCEIIFSDDEVDITQYVSSEALEELETEKAIGGWSSFGFGFDY